MKNDSVEHPKHYEGISIEVIELTEMFSFVLGNAIKYICRAGKKSGSPEVEDLKKAEWYLRRALNAPSQTDVREAPLKTHREAVSFMCVYAMRYPMLKTLFHSCIHSDGIAIGREDLMNTIKQIRERVKVLEGGKK